MSNQEAIALLRNLEDSLDSYCELHEEGKTAFRMAIEALSCSEFPNSSDTIYRQAAIDAVMEFMPSLTTPDGSGQFDREIFEAQEMFVDIGQALNELPSAQPEQLTDAEQRIFLKAIEREEKVR